MEILDVIRKRKSIRKYKSDLIPDNVFQRIMEAARLAPSGKNLQPWKFIIVRNEEMKVKLAEASRGQMFMAEAPMVIVVCGYPDKAYPRQGNYMSSWAIDCSIAMDHLMLQAQHEGLGTCWIGAFEEKDVKRLLQVPEDVKVLALTPLGYPGETPSPRSRKLLEEILSEEIY